MKHPDVVTVETLTRRWVENLVIGLNLCPFAKSVYSKDQVKIHVSEGKDLDCVSDTLVQLLQELDSTPAQQIDTTLLVIPYLFQDFYDFNDYMDVAEGVLERLDLLGKIQIANFHPAYQFAGTQADEMSNYTNRSPYPILHLIREASLDKATHQFPDASIIFERNIALMQELGIDAWEKLMEDKSSH